MLRCAASLVIAVYDKSTPHSSGLVRLACGSFYDAGDYDQIFMLTVHQ